MSVGIVTDSTSYLPAGWAQAKGISIVPVQVVIGARGMDERQHADAAAVVAALRAREPVTTSRPSPQRFLEAIAEQRSLGSDAVVITTMSAAMSSTHDSAVIAAREAGGDVRVVDSRSVGMGLGFAVVAGDDAAGRGPDAVVAAIDRSARGTDVFFSVDTLEYLRRGGRIGSAAALVGEALQVKPILAVRDGSVVAVDRVRTAGKAMARLAELAAQRARGQRVRIAVQHLDAADQARELADRIRAATGQPVVECPIGGVIGAHVGPGALAVVVAPGLG